MVLDQIINVIRYVIKDLLTMGPIFKAAIFPGFLTIMLIAIIAVWLERKMVAKMQLRIGPLYVGGPEGILQPIADFIKFTFKEVIVPEDADKPLFYLLPILSPAIVLAPAAFIPVSEVMVIVRSKVSLLLAMALISLPPLLLLLLGWASNSKYAFIGGMRAAYMQVAYELPMWLSIIPIALASGSFDFIEIVKAQQPLWFIITQPIGAFIFFITMLAEMGRLPYDLPEAEQEIVAGWYVEYTGVLFALLMLAFILAKLYILSLVFTIIYLGGWLPGVFLPEFWTMLKVFIVMGIIMGFRAVFGRSRIKTFIEAAWGKLIILAIVNILLVLLMISLGIFRG